MKRILCRKDYLMIAVTAFVMGASLTTGGQVIHDSVPSSKDEPVKAVSIPWGESAWALSVPRLEPDKEEFVFAKKTDAYISGTIMPAVGQVVSLYSSDKSKVIGTYRVRSDGGRGSFRISVPESSFAGRSSLTLYIKSGTSGHVMSSKHIPVYVRIGTSPSNGSSASGGQSNGGTGTNSQNNTGSNTTVNKQTASKKTVKKSSRPRTAAQGRAAAVAWAKRIAADNSFSYGAVPYSRHNGCYFCKTNGGKKKRAKGTRWAKGYKGKKWNRTYCCNPFVHAAYAHGAQHPKMLKYCKKKKAIDMTKATYRKMGCFKCLGKPKLSRLIPGDVLVSKRHVSMYCGNGEIVEATSLGGGKASWGARSIRVSKNAKQRYKSCRFIMRFTGY